MDRDLQIVPKSETRIIRFQRISCRRCLTADTGCTACDGTGYHTRLVTSRETMAALAALIGDRLRQTGH